MIRRSSFRSCMVGVALACAAVLEAHEDSLSIQVSARFERDATYAIDLTLNPDYLRSVLRDLAPSAETASSVRGLTPSVDARTAQLVAAFVAASHIAFDGRETRPRSAELVAGSGTGTLVVRVAGDIPQGVHAFTWANDLDVGYYSIRLTSAGDPAPVHTWLPGGQRSDPFVLDARVVPLPTTAVAWQYVRLGFLHILPRGLDHILFVLGIFLLNARPKAVLIQVTSFTIAHSVTLALSIVGVLRLPAAVVEPLIALSIVYVAVENLVTTELTPWRPALVFAFGLLHGLGFAGILHDVGVPRSQLLPALVSFNFGVELGQLAVLAAATLLIARPTRHRTWYRSLIVVPASLAIAVAGAYWSVVRVF